MALNPIRQGDRVSQLTYQPTNQPTNPASKLQLTGSTYHAPPDGVGEVAELGRGSGFLAIPQGSGGVLLGQVDKVGGEDEAQSSYVQRGHQLLCTHRNTLE